MVIVVVLIMLLPWVESHTDRRAARVARYRIDGHYALGMDPTEPGFGCGAPLEYVVHVHRGIVLRGVEMPCAGKVVYDPEVGYDVGDVNTVGRAGSRGHRTCRIR